MSGTQEVGGGGGSGLRKVKLAEEGKEVRKETPTIVVMRSRFKKRAITEGGEILESLKKKEREKKMREEMCVNGFAVYQLRDQVQFLSYFEPQFSYFIIWE